MNTRNFIFEIGTEELPPIALPELQSALAENIRREFANAGIEHGKLLSFSTPRRLAVFIESLSEKQLEQPIKRRGPPISAAFDKLGSPTRAAIAFAEICGVNLNQLERIREEKGEFLFFQGCKAGASTSSLIPNIVETAITALPIPKRMRWGSGDVEFVRPVHWVLILFGVDIIPATILGTQTGGSTQGHRFHAPEEIEVSDPTCYLSILREQGFVLADFIERREKIRKQVTACAIALGGKAIIPDSLLDEVTALVEWPIAVEGQFEERFLSLPREVLLSTLQEHQRYFAIEGLTTEVDKTYPLLPWFVTVSNIQSQQPELVRKGNERVVRARLSDAAFFWQQDRRGSLIKWREGLNAVTFQAKLGSIGQKVCRIEKISVYIATIIGCDPVQTARSASLCKNDLLSAIVGEFPALQGTMGAYYAAADGEDSIVATAIGEHYLPRGAGDPLPASACGAAISLADKIDTLAGIFLIGLKPNGTKDPFGLRRAAIGILRLIIELKLDLDLKSLVITTVAEQPLVTEAFKKAETSVEIYNYIMERGRAYYLEAGFIPEMFDAVMTSNITRPLDLDLRIRALEKFLKLPEAISLTAANKRIANILRKSESVDNGDVINVTLLFAASEIALQKVLIKIEPQLYQAMEVRDYERSLLLLTDIKIPIDSFFADVMVNDPNDELRINRLALVKRVYKLFNQVADFSRLPG